MQIAFMTSAIRAQRGTKEKIGTLDSMRMLKEMGFSYQDLSLSDMLFNTSEFNKPNWRELAYEVRELKEKLGITFVQSHLPFRKKDYMQCSDEYKQFMTQATYDAAEICSIVGVDWVVAHPIYTDKYSCECFDEQIQENLDFYAPVLDILKKGSCGMALENLADNLPSIRRFGCTAAELNALIDAFHDDKVGACIDFGHANLMYRELEPWFVRQIGHRLKATHVQDNYGVEDDHLAPFIGTVRWEKIMPVLKEIGYDGALVYETRIVSSVPGSMREKLFSYLRDVGSELIAMSER